MCFSGTHHTPARLVSFNSWLANSNTITSSYTPVNPDDLCRKGYVDSQDTALQNQINLKANTSDVTTALALKADLSYVDSQDTALQNQINLKANTSDVNTALALKADTSYVNSQDTALQNQINLKANTTDVNTSLSLKANLAGGNTFTGSQTYSDQTASRVCVFDGAKNLVSSSVTTTELGYVSGVTSGIQGQLNALSGTFANYLPLSGGNISGSLSVAGSTTLGTRLLGTPDANPGNFWIGLTGSGSEAQRLAVSINGAHTLLRLRHQDLFR